MGPAWVNFAMLTLVYIHFLICHSLLPAVVSNAIREEAVDTAFRVVELSFQRVETRPCQHTHKAGFGGEEIVCFIAPKPWLEAQERSLRHVRIDGKGRAEALTFRDYGTADYQTTAGQVAQIQQSAQR